MRVFGSWLVKSIRWIVIDVLCLGIMILVISLNNVSIHEWIYGAILCLFFLVVIGLTDYYHYYMKHRQLVKLQNVIKISIDSLDQPGDVLEEDYQQLVRLVHEDKTRIINHLENRKRELTEYYTMWVHQIKTPIAGMHLVLQTQEMQDSEDMEDALFRIEEYVQMALQYLRLDSDSSDLLIKEYSLDNIVREAVRKYAKIFIRKKISLNYESLDTTVLTDAKWLELVVEQLISNAVKYTDKGSVSIYMKENADSVLVIEDSGIGIRAEDLPRVCQRGYTGYNGHNDKRSTGIGLYLCKCVLEKLSHTIEIESEVGKGTRVYVHLAMEKRIHE